MYLINRQPLPRCCNVSALSTIDLNNLSLSELFSHLKDLASSKTMYRLLFITRSVVFVSHLVFIQSIDLNRCCDISITFSKCTSTYAYIRRCQEIRSFLRCVRSSSEQVVQINLIVILLFLRYTTFLYVVHDNKSVSRLKRTCHFCFLHPDIFS